jgi:hypothetical protein
MGRLYGRRNAAVNPPQFRFQGSGVSCQGPDPGLADIRPASRPLPAPRCRTRWRGTLRSTLCYLRRWHFCNRCRGTADRQIVVPQSSQLTAVVDTASGGRVDIDGAGAGGDISNLAEEAPRAPTQPAALGGLGSFGDRAVCVMPKSKGGGNADHPYNRTCGFASRGLWPKLGAAVVVAKVGRQSLGRFLYIGPNGRILIPVLAAVPQPAPAGRPPATRFARIRGRCTSMPSCRRKAIDR